MLRYLRDGAWLDARRTAGLDARLLAYNPELDVLGCVRGCACWGGGMHRPRRAAGSPAERPACPLCPRSYFRAALRWQPAGRVRADCWVSALPVSSFTPAALARSAGSRQRLAATVLLAAMVVGRAVVLLRRLLGKLRQLQAAASSPASGGASPARLAARTLTWLKSSLGSRRHARAPPRRQSATATGSALLQAAVTDRLLLLDLVTTALMLLAVVLLGAALVAEQRLELRLSYSL